MATTTPNFGWAVPTSSDLVKNGATAIETLGDAIDASLVDLKGGTTGQVLTKASDTDMDFSWATASGGSNTFYAGKNKIINGDFGIWQRGTSFALSSSSAYTADRFIGDAGSMAYTFSRQTFTPATAPVAGYEGTYFYRALAVSGSGGYPKIMQKIEDVRAYAGQAITLSFWAKASSAITVSPDLIQEFGSGGSSTVYTGTVSTSITTSWARYTINYTVPSISGKTIGTGSSLTVSFNLPSSGTASFDIWGVQLEAGSTATDFQTATGTIQGELAACQRYYEQTFASAATESANKVSVYSDSNYTQGTRWKITKRVAPSVTVYSSNGGTSNRIRQISTNVNYTPASISDIGVDGFNIFTGIGQSNMMDFHYTASAEL